MLTPADLINSVNSIKSGSCLTQLKANLSAAGFTVGELASIDSMLNDLMTANTPPADLTGLIAEVGDNLESNIRDLATEAKSVQKSVTDKKLHEAHEVQNARKSISTKEPVASGAKFTKPVNIQDANYTTKEDYPETYGFIDSVKNWFKINKRKGHAEFVHQSATQIKVDKRGNVTMYITGSLKQIIKGDYYLEVGGSMDAIVKGKKHESVKGEVDEKFGATHTTNVSGVRREKASQIHHN